MRALRTFWLFAIFSLMFTGCGDDGEVKTPQNPEEDVDTPVPPEPGPPSAPVERVDVPEVTEIPATCNGHEELCERRYDEVTFPGTHNSMSNSEDGWVPPNQKYGIARQLEDGIRVMLLDIYYEKNQLKLCHTACFLGQRSLDDALFDLRDFLRRERGEVLTLILQDETDAYRIIEAFEERGLDEWAYVHEGGEWPSLRELIDMNKRLVVSAERSGRDEDTPWYHHAWDIMLDNPYSYEEADDFSCRANRGSVEHSLYLLNHWLQKPLSKPALAAVANAREVLLGHALACEEEQERRVNFLAVDHYDVGDLFEVVRVLNGLE